MPGVSAPDPADQRGWRCRASCPVPPVTAGLRPRTEEEISVRRLHARASGGRSSLRPPDAPLEPKDAPLHLHGAGRHLHHRSPADARADRAGGRLRAERLRAEGTILFVGTKKQCQDSDRRRGEARRHALREPSLAGRPAHQLAHDLRAHRAPARAAAPARRGAARAAAVEGAHLHDGRAREARGQPRRRRRHEVGARRRLRRRPPQGAARRARGAPARAAGHRPRRHELRPGRRRLRHPGQRRRDPLLQPHRPRDRERDRGGQDEGDRRGDDRSPRQAQAEAQQPAPGGRRGRGGRDGARGRDRRGRRRRGGGGRAEAPAEGGEEAQ